jgi:uncharacterized protein YjiK
MKNLKYILLLIFFTNAVQCQKAKKIKADKFISLKIPEPSDLCFSQNQKSIFIVSDQGFLFETDTEGKIIRKANFDGIDCEAVFADDINVYVVEETTRKIKIFDTKDLKLKRTIYLPYTGGRNKGYEAFTFNKFKNKFIIITEKDPIYLFELDTDFKIVNEINLGKMARDISSATYYNGFLWLLSDEDRTVFKLKPDNYEVLEKWKIKVLNPEGIAFDSFGKMLIQSDDLQRIYFFKAP